MPRVNLPSPRGKHIRDSIFCLRNTTLQLQAELNPTTAFASDQQRTVLKRREMASTQKHHEGHDAQLVDLERRKHVPNNCTNETLLY